MRNKKTNPRQSKHCDILGKNLYMSEEELLHKLKDNPRPLLLILDCIQDPRNLGACFRSANGAGVDALIIPKDKSVAVTPTVRKVSAGAADYTPLCRVTNLARFIQKIKELGIWTVGTTDKATDSIYKIDFTLPTALIMGSEGQGLRKLTSQNCDFLAKLPMKGEIKCLNVSVATGICLYEAVRQRQAKL